MLSLRDGVKAARRPGAPVAHGTAKRANCDCCSAAASRSQETTLVIPLPHSKQRPSKGCEKQGKVKGARSDQPQKANIHPTSPTPHTLIRSLFFVGLASCPFPVCSHATCQITNRHTIRASAGTVAGTIVLLVQNVVGGFKKFTTDGNSAEIQVFPFSPERFWPFAFVAISLSLSYSMNAVGTAAAGLVISATRRSAARARRNSVLTQPMVSWSRRPSHLAPHLPCFSSFLRLLSHSGPRRLLCA